MRRSLLALLAVASLACQACDYGHLAAGQLRVLMRRQPLDEALRDPARSADERALLGLVGSVRAFARELGLEVGNQYTSFVDWPGDRIVTTLVRTRPGSLEAIGWWYPFLGRLPYRGYFDQARAEREAARLSEEQGYDVCVSPVTAYSTLGWLDDPVTSPMLGRGVANLVETLLHELVHATVFIDGDADFNEGVALFIGQEAALRYFARAAAAAPAPMGPSEDPAPLVLPSAERMRAWLEDRRLVEAVVLAFRDRLAETAEAGATARGASAAARAGAVPSPPEARDQRAAAERVVRGELAALPLGVLDPALVAADARLSDACLALRGTYSRDLPRHASLLAAMNDDLPAMIRHLVDWAERDEAPETFFSSAPRAERHAEPRSE